MLDDASHDACELRWLKTLIMWSGTTTKKAKQCTSLPFFLTTMPNPPDVEMTSDPGHTRSHNSHCENVDTNLLVLMLKSIWATDRAWDFHPGTGMFYHADKTWCNTCIKYIMHLSTVKNDGNMSLFKALDKLDLYWVKKLENHVEMKWCLNWAFDDGVHIWKCKGIMDCKQNGCRTAKEGKDQSGSASDKGKGKASATEN